jgi:hypothetical protein
MDPIGFHGPLAAATPDVCAAFQRKAVVLPKNWRAQHPKSKPEAQVQRLSPNTVLKWTRTLQAAYQRANRTAGRKCVRGVVSEEKLLTENPWDRFTWIGGREKPIRQFDGHELVSFLDYLGEKWATVTVAAALVKVFLWSQNRRSEAASLTWTQERTIGDEHHFEVVGKHGVLKWFRLPELVYQELREMRTRSPYMFAVYTSQLRQFYQDSQTPWKARQVANDFDPENLGGWLHERIVDWSKTLPKGHASAHVFRKTGLQYALDGEEDTPASRVAADARVSEPVLKRHYTTPNDKKRRAESNRNFARIVATLPPAVAVRYGYVAMPSEPLQVQMQAAVEAADWELVGRLSAELASRTKCVAG